MTGDRKKERGWRFESENESNTTILRAENLSLTEKERPQIDVTWGL
jgi:hypothetical protein